MKQHSSFALTALAVAVSAIAFAVHTPAGRILQPRELHAIRGGLPDRKCGLIPDCWVSAFGCNLGIDVDSCEGFLREEEHLGNDNGCEHPEWGWACDDGSPAVCKNTYLCDWIGTECVRGALTSFEVGKDFCISIPPP